MMDKMITFLIMFWAVLFSGCDQRDLPREISIEGMRVLPEGQRESVLQVNLKADNLIILSWDGQSSNTLTIRSWPKDLMGLNRPGLSLLSQVLPHPEGAVKILSFYQQDYLRLKIVDNAKKYFSVLPQWTLLPGSRLDHALEGKGQLSGVIVSGPQSQAFDILPGETRQVGGPDFHLFSAYRQEDSTPSIADDTVELCADYVLIWSRE